ncbi:hypothetical protein BB560_005400 [Smittium megazygosporum]|uniref:D-aminoacyl-tRNA deacylase n=1 Tax=Smittium megazygosporum TaxID=133381 RepID=A0A2T9Z6A6_9FUNG|nr:hypothetical protein BB560_005400 [Smittium megazygosporum]
MRAVVQKVKYACVKVDSKIVGEINNGICALIGFSNEDTEKDSEYMVKRLLNLKLFNSSKGEKTTVSEMGYEVLCVSQFTLFGKTVKGNKPDFHDSMKTETAKTMYKDFLTRLGEAYDHSKIKDGEFGAMMEVDISTDGPLTLQLDSRKIEYL